MIIIIHQEGARQHHIRGADRRLPGHGRDQLLPPLLAPRGGSRDGPAPEGGHRHAQIPHGAAG